MSYKDVSFQFLVLHGTKLISFKTYFVGAVCAGSNQADLEVFRPVVGLDSLAELGDGGGQIGGEGTVDVRLELGKVDFDKLVVLGALILTQFLGV